MNSYKNIYLYIGRHKYIFNVYIYMNIYIYIYMCVCVCVTVALVGILARVFKTVSRLVTVQGCSETFFKTI